MIPELKPDLIYNFRKKVHDHNHFIRLYFIDYKHETSTEGIDIWSKICSCMDWLTVAVEGIKKPDINKNMNITSLEFTHFIVTIDMIVEAVNHLWRSIGLAINTEQPYIKDKSIFNGKEFDRVYTDEEYFKEIRSWFGVHAVNGNVVKIKGLKDVRFFSSWSSHGFFEQDEFHLQLYSNNTEAEKKYGGTKKVSIKSLIHFAELRYNTLSELMDHIDTLYLKIKTTLQNTPINFDDTKDDLYKLNQLYQQANDRILTKEYYENEIEDYMLFLSCDLNEFEEAEREIVNRYLYELKAIVPVYYKIVQDVDDGEFEVFELLHMRSQIVVNNHYDFSKALEYASGETRSSANRVSVETLIRKGLLPSYCLSLSAPCLYLLLHAIDNENV